jgi:hemolysin III
MTQTIFYKPQEEKINVVSHAIGFALSIVGTLYLILHSALKGTAIHVVSFSIFGISMILLYLASTLYHNSKDESTRKKLKVFDHAAIYVLIAGTYTPFTLVVLPGKIGWTIFGVSWGIAFVGIILKLFFAGRFKIASTVLYVAMGWIIVLVINPLVDNFSAPGLFWLFAGGVAYTVGAVLYSIKKIPYNHAMFHILVLAGTFCHFVAVGFNILH